MHLVEIKAALYDEFCLKAERCLYQQSCESQRSNTSHNLSSKLLALQDEAGQILCVSKIIFLRYLKYFESAEIYFGPIMSPAEPQIFANFLSQLIIWLKKQKRILRFRIVPLIQRCYHKAPAEIEANPQAESYETILQEHKLQRLALDFHEAAGIQARFFYVKDITAQSYPAIIKSVKSSCRNDMRKAQRYGVKIRLLQAEDCALFNELLAETLHRTGMPSFTANYLDESYFHDYGSKMLVPLAYLDCKHSLQVLQAEGQEILVAKQRIGEEAVTKKTAQRLQELDEALKSTQKRAHEVAQLKQSVGNIIPLAAAQFFVSSTDLVYSQSTAREQYLHLAPVYAIHDYMFRFAAAQQLRYYNFFSVLDPQCEGAEADGVQAFKERFNGYYEEWLGSYELILRPKFHAGLQLLLKARRKKNGKH